jgi:hypothetical protein
MSLINTQNGLTSAGAGIDAASAGTGTAQIAYGSFNNASPSTGFVTNGPDLITNYNEDPDADTVANANFLEFIETAPGPNVNLVSGNEVYLGSFQVQVGSQSTTYNLTSLNNETFGVNGGEDGNTLTGDGTDLDMPGSPDYTGADASPAYTFTVAVATPEPGSFGLAAAVTAIGVSRRRRAAR